MGGEPFILLDLPHSRELMLSILHDAGLDPEVRFRSASYETVRTFVANGHGYSILHQRPQHGLTYDGGHVAAVAIKDRVPELSIVLARLRTSVLRRGCGRSPRACVTKGRRRASCHSRRGRVHGPDSGNSCPRSGHARRGCRGLRPPPLPLLGPPGFSSNCPGPGVSRPVPSSGVAENR